MTSILLFIIPSFPYAGIFSRPSYDNLTSVSNFSFRHKNKKFEFQVPVLRIAAFLKRSQCWYDVRSLNFSFLFFCTIQLWRRHSYSTVRGTVCGTRLNTYYSYGYPYAHECIQVPLAKQEAVFVLRISFPSTVLILDAGKKFEFLVPTRV